jgi:hypothetical protein
VSTEEGQVLANQYGVEFLETSARENANVGQFFFKMAAILHKKQSINLNLGSGPGSAESLAELRSANSQ